MKAAKERVLKQIDELPDNVTIATSELAEKLNLSRSVVSHYLNQLLKDKKVQKLLKDQLGGLKFLLPIFLIKQLLRT
ncbi:winged helix-turn-helix transcriptional regulator [Lactobacillus sp. R2/2]|nr:winged helix-turn-helix transcriptional regulator [Lactobacillus sp. R2/2]